MDSFSQEAGQSRDLVTGSGIRSKLKVGRNNLGVLSALVQDALVPSRLFLIPPIEPVLPHISVSVIL